MTRRDAIVLGSRLLAIFLTIGTLAKLTYLPSYLDSFLRYASHVTPTSSANDYLRHHYLIELGFLVTRIIGYALTAAWLFRCGPDIEELLLPGNLRQDANRSGG